MSVLHRNSRTPEEPATAPTERAAQPPSATGRQEVSRTRTSAAWLGVCTAAVVLVVLIIFMLQNTGRVEVSFLWMQGSLPLAMALLIAGVGAALLTMMVGVARITQLRRRFRRDL
jgi:lipopolysaccharide assembly protein A